MTPEEDRRYRERAARKFIREATATDRDLAAFRGTVAALVTEVLTRPGLTDEVRVAEAYAFLTAGCDLEADRFF